MRCNYFELFCLILMNLFFTVELTSLKLAGCDLSINICKIEIFYKDFYLGITRAVFQTKISDFFFPVVFLAF